MSKDVAPETISEIKAIRVAQKEILDRIDDLMLPYDRLPHGGEVMLAKRAGQTVRHWLGEALGVIRDTCPGACLEHPYPEADNPGNTVISPTADTGD